MEACNFHFFILSKGQHVGMPVKNSAPDCFVVSAKSAEEKKILFGICYSLWLTKIYEPYIRHATMPTLEIGDVSFEIDKAYRESQSSVAEIKNAIHKLSDVIHTEKLLGLQLKLTAEMKSSLSKQIIRHIKSR